MMSSFWRNRDHHHPILGVAGSWLLAVSHVGRPAGLFCSRYWNQHTKYTECAIHSFLVSSVLDNWEGTTVIVCTTLTIILHSYRVLYTFGRNDGQFQMNRFHLKIGWAGSITTQHQQLLRMKNENDNDPHPLFKVGRFCVIQNYHQVLFGFQFRRIDFVNMYVESQVKKKCLLHGTSLIMRFK